MSIEGKATVSKQAIEERMRPETKTMIKKVLNKEISKSLLTSRNSGTQNPQKFKSVKIEDSAIINLPTELSFAFPGNVSKGKKKS